MRLYLYHTKRLSEGGSATKMVNAVCLVKTSNFDDRGIKKAVFEALDSLSFQPQRAPKRVAVKINLCYYWDYSTGQTTDPRVTAATIDYIRERWNDKATIQLVESDASAVRMKYAFKMLGYEELAAKKSVDLVNLSLEPSNEATVSVDTHKYTFRIPKTISNADVFINIPKLKTHGLTKISCTLKNTYGCNPKWKKVVYHSKLDEVICALNKLMKPDVILVDGIVAFGHHAERMGLIMTGRDPVAVDFIAAQIMGFNPLEINHLQLAAREDIGDFTNITLIGEDPNSLKQVFPKPPPPLKKSTLLFTNLRMLFSALLSD